MPTRQAGRFFMQTASLLARQIRLQRLTFAVFMFALSCVVAVSIFMDYRLVRATEGQNLVTQANIVSANIQMHLTSIDRVLEEILAMGFYTDLDRQRDHMQSLVNAMPIIRAISILDVNGRQIIGTRDSNNKGNFSGRPYFLNVKADPQPLLLYISTPYISVSGDLTIALSKAMHDRSGRFAGVVAAAVEPRYIKGLMESTLYAPDMWAALRHRDSRAAIRVGGGGASEQRYEPLALMGDNIGPVPLPPPLSSDKSKVMPLGGPDSRQLMATSTVADYAAISSPPLEIVTGRDFHAAMADWRRFAYLQGGLLALFIVITTAGLLFAQRRRRRYVMRREEYVRRIRKDQELLQAQEQDYRIIVERTTTCIIRLDTNGRLSYANPAFCDLFGIAAADVRGRRFSSLMAQDDIQTAAQSVSEALRQPSELHLRTQCLTPTGSPHMEWTLCSVAGPEHGVRAVIGIGHDISAHISLNEKLRSLADHDGLTGVFNQRYFMEAASAQVSLAHRNNKPLSVITMDLDHFKRINDTYGHQAGDRALQVCARKMKESSREHDLAARVGGEEFCILLPDTSLEPALLAAQRLRSTIQNAAIDLEDGTHFHLTASLGVATLEPEESIESLMKRSDQALYTAKQNGRNRVEAAPGL